MSDPLVLGDIQNRWYTVLCYTVFRWTGTVEHPYRKHHSNIMLQENHSRKRVNHIQRAQQLSPSTKSSNCYSHAYCSLERLSKFRSVITSFNGQNDLLKLAIDESKLTKTDQWLLPTNYIRVLHPIPSRLNCSIHTNGPNHRLTNTWF